MAYALVASTAVSGGGPTPDIDTTGANMIVVHLHMSGFLESILAARIVDSKGNNDSYVGPSEGAPSAGGLPHTYAVNGLFICLNPIVGAGHNWTLAGVDFPGAGMEVLAFSGAPASLVVDSYTANNGGGPMVTSSPLTPTAPNDLFICGLAIGANTLGGYGNSDTAFIDDAFIKPGQAFGGPGIVNGAVGYKIQEGQNTEGPAWSWTTIDTWGVVLLAALRPSPPVVTLGAGTPILEVLGRRSVPTT